ncbi:UNVERIFIED_CONTAM: ADP-ribosylation factor protein 1 [Gekko kuhli]
MYTLLSGLYKYMFQRDEYCVLILGLDNAGKTTFLEQTKTRFTRNYKGMNFSKITTTVGLNIGTIDVGKARLMFWDLGGQEELQSLWDKYYAESHGIIYVIDSTDEERLSESKRAFEKMITSEVLEGVPLLVLANKQDVEVRPLLTVRRLPGVALCVCVKCFPLRATLRGFASNLSLPSSKLCLAVPVPAVLKFSFPPTPGPLLSYTQGLFKGCLSIPDIKTAFSDCINKIGKRDCLTQACSALTGKGVNEGIEWMVKCVVRNIHRPPRKKDIT